MSGIHASTGRHYGDKEKTPVPFPAYRCKATAKEAEREGRTHLCKITIDHDEGQHHCLCGKKWDREGVLA